MLETLVEKTIKKYNLISLGDRVGVAVSGGVDSMVLLHVLYTLSRRSGFYVYALHFEHGIRAEESVGDMHFVEEQCEKMHIPFYSGSEDVPVIAAQTGENLEAAARRLRYAFFEERKRALKLSKIAIAHHKDDFAETFLLNLVRGSGMAGLTTMKYQRTPGIIRPMLDISRKDIEAYASAHNIPFRVDSTNAALKYARNYIRAEILPRMAALNPEVSSAIMRASEILGEEDSALFEYAKSEYHKISRREEGQIVLDLVGFNALPKAIRRRVVRMALLEFTTLQDVEKQSVDRVLDLAASGRTGKGYSLEGRFFAHGSYRALIITDKLITIERKGVFPASLGTIEPWEGEFFLMQEVSRQSLPRKFPSAASMVQYADMDALKGAVLRTRKSGDYLTPFGMEGTKKLKDWMIDEKIPREMRGSMPLLARDSEILWIVGHVLSEHVKVRRESKRICKISYTYNTGEESAKKDD